MTINPIIPVWLMLLVCVFGVFISGKQGKMHLVRRIAIIVLLFVINLRVMTPINTEVQVSNNLNVLFVVDTTISMLAEDYQGGAQRIAAVKADCGYIIDRLKGSRFSIIAFDNQARRLTPFIDDRALTLETLDNLQVIKEEYSVGSSLNVAREETIRSLETAYKKQEEKRVNILFFISDGEITNTDLLASFTGTAKYIDNGAVLGYGTPEGGVMRVVDDLTNEEEFIQDKTKTPFVKALSKLDESTLKRIAGDMGVDYIRMDQQTNIAHKLNEIDQKLQTKVVSINTFDDIYYIFVLPLVPLLVWELVAMRRRMFV
ncbi:MAG: VWA domain-containing protein [Peptococcaceae bacterium]|nr:VWA domain-containing protein [Peptococcaceae bacterium]